MKNLVTEMENTGYFENIEVLSGEVVLYHSTFIETARKILANGFMGYEGSNLHATSLSLSTDPSSVVFATDYPQKDYGNTIIEIRINGDYVKAFHNEYDEVEYLIPLSSIEEVSEYCD